MVDLIVYVQKSGYSKIKIAIELKDFFEDYEKAAEISRNNVKLIYHLKLKINLR